MLKNDQIAIVHGVSLDHSFKELADITFPNHAEYAAKHGYLLKSIEIQPSEKWWGKIRGLQEVFSDSSIHRAFWIDADAIFTNMQLSLTNHLPDGKVVLSCNRLGPNTGTLWLQNCPEVRHLLWRIATEGHRLFATRAWFDQSALRFFALYPPYNQWVTYVEQTRMNSIVGKFQKRRPQDGFGEWQPDHLILHMAGIDHEAGMEREGVLQYLKNIVCLSKNKELPH